MRFAFVVTLVVLVAAGCNGGSIPLPDEFKELSTLSVRVTGSAVDDIWWPGCDAGSFAALHWDGGGWKQVAKVEGAECLQASESVFQSGGKGVVWLSQSKLLRITTDGKVEDHTAEVGNAPAPIIGIAGDLFGLRSNAEGMAIVHFEKAQLKETLPAPPNGGLVPFARDDMWSYGAAFAEVVHFDGTAWGQNIPGPSPTAIGAGFAANDRWAIGENVEHLWHWDGTAWNQVDLTVPELHDAGSLSVLAIVGDSAGKPIVIGLYMKYPSDGSGGFASKFVAFRQLGTGWAEAEVFGHRDQDACSGYSGCGRWVSGTLQDGTLLYPDNDAGGETTLKSFKP